MPRRSLPFKLCAAAAVLLAGAAACCAPAPRGYVLQVSAESPEARAARHREVAERRASAPLVIVHRGAAAFAPENTLEAYAAAMDYGADGCEIDVRRTRDGILVLFHDDMLDNLTTGLGTVDRFTYRELLQFRPRRIYGTATAKTRMPTFAAVLELARRRRMLLHLDVKQTGLDADISRMLDQADAWDHVVAVNAATAPGLAKDPRVKPIRYKGPGLFEGRKDWDPALVRAQLALPGDAVMVDDPRVAAAALARPAYRPVPLPALRAGPPQPLAPATTRETDHFRRALKDPLPEAPTFGGAREMLDRLLPAHPPTRSGELLRATNAAPGEVTPLDRTERIIRRAALAQRCADDRIVSDRRIEWLEFQVRSRTLHRDWQFHGLDGALAARALGELGSLKSVPLLVWAFQRADPELEQVVNRSFGPYPLSWTEFRMKMHILPALGKLRCAESKRFLLHYLSLGDADLREMGPDYRAEAVRAVFQQKLARSEIEELLRSPHTAVRGTAIQLCLDHPTRDRTAALRKIAPWALDLPSAARAPR